MSSFISTQFLVLNLDGLFDASFNKFSIFWYSIVILIYLLNLLNNLSFLEIYVLIYTFVLGTNFNSSIICCLSSGDMYLFLCEVIFTSSSLSLCNSLAGFFFEILVILSAILLPIKSPVASAILSNFSF